MYSILIGAAAGIVLGIFFFGGLRRHIQGLNENPAGLSMILFSFPVRLIAAGIVFGGLAKFGGIGAILAGTVGFAIIQILILMRR